MSRSELAVAVVCVRAVTGWGVIGALAFRRFTYEEPRVYPVAIGPQIEQALQIK